MPQGDNGCLAAGKGGFPSGKPGQTSDEPTWLSRNRASMSWIASSGGLRIGLAANSLGRAVLERHKEILLASDDALAQ